MRPFTQAGFLLLLSGSMLLAAEEEIKIPVKMEIPDLKAGEKVEWDWARVGGSLQRTDKAEGLKFIPLKTKAWKANATILAAPAKELDDQEWTLTIRVNPSSHFLYEGELIQKATKKSLAALKKPLIVKLKRIYFYSLSAQVVNANGQPVAGEPVVLWQQEEGGSSAIKRIYSDKEGKVTFRDLPDDQTWSLRSGRSDEPLGSRFEETTIKPGQLAKLKGPVILRLPKPLLTADVVVEEMPGKTVPLPKQWKGPVMLDETVFDPKTKKLIGSYHIDHWSYVKDGKLYVYPPAPAGDPEISFPSGSELAKKFVIVSPKKLHVPKVGEKPVATRIVVKKR